MNLKENTVFANRYELAKLLGRGGFSEVWLAKDQWTHLNVAIKVYAPGQGMEEDGMREFCGELAGVYDINHPNLLKPQHVDAWENMPYLIMAYCPNGSCERLIGKVTEEQIWKMIHDVASGLAYLHEKGLVHQDIKPANVMIDEDGHYLITDFGVSSRARSTLRKSVVSSTGGGTTAYMGPERFSKQPAPTKASDIWSFGAMCFEMVEGYVPFGENGGVSQKIGADIPVINADVSDALKYAITMMLQKETWDRPTAAKLVEWSAAPQRIGVDRNLLSDELSTQHYVKNNSQTVRLNNSTHEPLTALTKENLKATNESTTTCNIDQKSDEYSNIRSIVDNMIMSGQYREAYNMCLAAVKKDEKNQYALKKIQELVPMLKEKSRNDKRKHWIVAIILSILSFVILMLSSVLE